MNNMGWTDDQVKTILASDKIKQPTNADHIRAMSDEELADFMFSTQKAIWNALCEQLGWSNSKVTDTSESGTTLLDWLKQPADK